MLWLLSCILTKSSEISSDCFLSECDTALSAIPIDVFFEPAQASLDSVLTCRSSQIFPFASAQYFWSHEGQPLQSTEESIILSSDSFQQGDRLSCRIEWYEDEILYAEGDSEIVIP